VELQMCGAFVLVLLSGAFGLAAILTITSDRVYGLGRCP